VSYLSLKSDFGRRLFALSAAMLCATAGTPFARAQQSQQAAPKEKSVTFIYNASRTWN
jgi:hypothetical protein